MNRGRKVVKTTQVYKASHVANQLDMRGTNKFGRDLEELVFESVRATQHPIMLALPDEIVLSHRQFTSVEHNTQEMDYTTDRIYVTPLNIMEIVIDQDYQHVGEEELMRMMGEDPEDTTPDDLFDITPDNAPDKDFSDVQISTPKDDHAKS
jgi:hypothetical protein